MQYTCLINGQRVPEPDYSGKDRYLLVVTSWIDGEEYVHDYPCWATSTDDAIAQYVKCWGWSKDYYIHMTSSYKREHHTTAHVRVDKIS